LWTAPSLDQDCEIGRRDALNPIANQSNGTAGSNQRRGAIDRLLTPVRTAVPAHDFFSGLRIQKAHRWRPQKLQHRIQTAFTGRRQDEAIAATKCGRPAAAAHSRLEAFNIGNWVNLNNPNSSVTAATFGRVTSARTGTGGPRVIQIGGKYIF